MNCRPSNRFRWQHSVFWIAIVGLLVFIVEAAHAASTVISTDFGSPYVSGALQGQPSTPPVWTTAGSGSSTATVQSGIGVSGSPAVQVVRAAAANADRRWAIPVTGYPTQRFVIVDWDMRVAQATVPGGFGPFMGVDTYDADVAPYVLGALGVDATTGDVLYQFQDSGVLTETGLVVNFNQWHHFRLVLDFASDTYKGYVNGSQVASTGFVDRSFGLNNFTDADIATFAAAADAISQSLSATAVFDNFVVRDGLLGDYNVDGMVDNADFTTWRTSFGNAVAPAGNLADGNLNAAVDAADYVIWRDNRGTSISSAAGFGTSFVPEPTGITVTVTGILLVLAIRQRRRSRG
jgi:hypothetical protein